MADQPAPPHRSPSVRSASGYATALPRYLALAYAGLVIYGSLHPFSGWRASGVSPFAYFEAAWPRYWTVFDLLINTIAYVPLGFFLTLWLRRLPLRWTSACVSLVLATLLSVGLECVQNWLPSRVPSNLDVACNACGAALGCVLATLLVRPFLFAVRWLQVRVLGAVPHAELGLVLVGLWLLTQLSPETVLFGTGDLRHLLPIPPAVPYAAGSFFAFETGIIVCNTAAIGALTRLLLTERYSSPLVLALLFAAAFSIRTFSAALLVGPENAFSWLTPGAGLGLMVGGALLSVLLLLPPAGRIALAGLALMAGAVLVNLAPPNPYSVAALAAWRQGHFLNFNGLTRWTASLWPFIALPFLMLLGRRI